VLQILGCVLLFKNKIKAPKTRIPPPRTTPRDTRAVRCVFPCQKAYPGLPAAVLLSHQPTRRGSSPAARGRGDPPSPVPRSPQRRAEWDRDELRVRGPAAAQTLCVSFMNNFRCCDFQGEQSFCVELLRVLWAAFCENCRKDERLIFSCIKFKWKLLLRKEET